MKKVGIVGGTFDPIHLGHLMLGRQAYEEYSLDEIWYMPSRQPPHKKDHHVTEAKDRLEMVRLATYGTPHYRLSDFELTRTQGNTYTADTLRLLNETYSDTEFYFIVGADSIFDIEKWYHPEQVLNSAIFLAARRECGQREHSLDEQIRYLEGKYHARIKTLHSVEIDISSEEIRESFLNGDLSSVKALIPAAVYEYIIKNGLYTTRTTNQRTKNMIKDIFELRKILQSKLSPDRYEHTLSVSYSCIALAMRYGYDLKKAELAGILHDCAKRYDNDTIIKKCNKYEIELTESELNAPPIIHAKLGAYMAEHKYGVTEPEILSAIACHTTGKPYMGLLDKILYVADFIEPRRIGIPGLDKVRRLAFENLDDALFETMDGILKFLEHTGAYTDNMTKEAYEYYKALREEQKSE